MDLLAALRLQLEWGADEALADEPIDRFRPPTPENEGKETATEKAGLAAPAPRQDTIPRPAAPAGGTAAALADKAAAAASTVDELEAALAGFTACALRDTAMNLVFADGNAGADLMLIGDAPGPEEDRSGRPFAGKEGLYLDRMLASIGLGRDDARFTLLIPWRPPGNRPPTQSEIAVCLPFLVRHIVLIRPRWLLLLGPLAAKTLLGSQRGRPGRGELTWAEADIPGLGPLPALTMPPPAAAMRTPVARKQAWAVLRLLRRTKK